MNTLIDFKNAFPRYTFSSSGDDIANNLQAQGNNFAPETDKYE